MKSWGIAYTLEESFVCVYWCPLTYVWRTNHSQFGPQFGTQFGTQFGEQFGEQYVAFLFYVQKLTLLLIFDLDLKREWRSLFDKESNFINNAQTEWMLKLIIIKSIALNDMMISSNHVSFMTQKKTLFKKYETSLYETSIKEMKPLVVWILISIIDR